MLRGHRCALTAAFGWLTLAAAPPPDNGAHSETAKAAQGIQDSLNAIARAETKQADTGEDNAPCAKGQYNNKSDLCAQWYAALSAGDAAYWSKWTFWLSALSLGLSGIGLVALYVTIRLGREANAISREGNVAQQRAWLKIIKPTTMTVWSGPTELTVNQLHVDVKNIGQSVALGAHCWAELFVVPVGDVTDTTYFDLSVPDEPSHARTIWPEDDSTFTVEAQGEGYEVAGFAEQNAYFRVFLTVAVEYKTVFDQPKDKARRTEMTFELRNNHVVFTRTDNKGYATEARNVDFAPNIVT